VSERVEVWRERDGFWRWRYRNDEGVELLSNESHVTRDRAVHTASLAYPGVRVEDRVDAMATGLGLGDAIRKAGLGGAVMAATVAVAVPIGIRAAWRRLMRKLE
jgi:hypothetical protein